MAILKYTARCSAAEQGSLTYIYYDIRTTRHATATVVGGRWWVHSAEVQARIDSRVTYQRRHGTAACELDCRYMTFEAPDDLIYNNLHTNTEQPVV